MPDLPDWLRDLPPNRRRRWVESLIRREEGGGIATCYPCPACGERLCSTGMCAACWREAVEQVTKEVPGGEA